MELRLNGESIENAAREKRDELSKKSENDDNTQCEKKLQFMNEFLNKANFKELKRLGFDGEKDMNVKVVEKEDGFSISKTWKSILSQT